MGFRSLLHWSGTICWKVVCCCVVNICCTGLAVAAPDSVQLVGAAGTRYSCPVSASRASWKPPGEARGGGGVASWGSQMVGPVVMTEGAGAVVSQGRAAAAAGRSASASE